jgi:hypothetical protein
MHAARFFAGVPAVRIRSFALEARSLDAARMLEMEPHKRYTLAAALVSRQIARCLDDLGEMLIKKVRKMHRRTPYALRFRLRPSIHTIENRCSDSRDVAHLTATDLKQENRHSASPVHSANGDLKSGAGPKIRCYSNTASVAD